MGVKRRPWGRLWDRPWAILATSKRAKAS